MIRSTYYVENPRLVVVTKDSYLTSFDTISKLQENGILLINTMKSDEELKKMIPDNLKDKLIGKHIKVYTIDAMSLAGKLGLGNKISMIMESAMIYLSKMIDFDLAKDKLKEYIKQKFFKKGEEILEANYKSLDEAICYLKEISLEDEVLLLEDEKELTVFEKMSKRLGDTLKTSDFLNMKDGTYLTGTSELEKRCVSETVPKWLKNNCIECNQCSLVCPHGVIRPFLLSQEEYKNAPKYIQERCLTPTFPELKQYYYTIGVSVADCTGCGLCIKNCPGKNGEKALMFSDLQESLKNKEQDIFNYLVKNIEEKKEIDKTIISGSQFARPRFRFSGACAGCGETAYIKLLTQLFGDYMVIANATGCSSIYGASMPSMPYTVPWANSLFEDNAEYGYGMLVGSNVMKSRIYKIMSSSLDNPNHDLFMKWMENMDDYEITKEVYDQLDYDTVPKELIPLKDYIVKRSIWTIGGDGWAYDIGYSGIDHVLSTNDDVNILVLDSQVYSNTGGQASKASPKGAIAAFATSGKKTNQKDLARMALAYPNVYVAQVSIGANMQQVVRAFHEAERHKGPSIIIAYTPCISHGIDGGMINALDMERLAVKSGYFQIFRYNPDEKEFHLDFKRVDFSKYEDFLEKQTRYKMLKVINPEHAASLLEDQKKDSMDRYYYYASLDGSVK
jgi:pyruvate-ferredoxin/flavodoxin oxidoreductase